jgi:menaquinone-dependent protoporphyrinogen oxidase
MTSDVLVAYATKHGGTTGIAEAIGQTLRDAGQVSVDVRPAGEVRDLADYRAVVVGSALYMGKWQKDGIDFLKRFERELRERPVWLFSSGPTGGTADADAAVTRAATSPDAVPAPGDVAKRAQRIGTRGHATFAGRIGDEANGFLERWMPRGDWRDFDLVAEWARHIAAQLAPAAVG